MGGEQITVKEFELLYRTNYRKVRAVILHHGFRNGQADDLIQETFVTAWEKRSTLKDAQAFSAWIMSIARNRCLMALRSMKSTAPIAATDDIGEDDHHHVVLQAEPGYASLAWEHNLGLLRELIKRHDSEPRATVARLFYLEEKSVRDICSALSLKQNTVLSHLRRFRLAVSEALLELLETEELVLPT